MFLTEFQKTVAGPYSPLEPAKWDSKHLVNVRVVTAGTVADLSNLYYSYLSWIGHEQAMSQSMRHAAVAMGEIDEPDETPTTHNPLTSAGFFGISLAMSAAMRAIYGDCAPIENRGDRNSVVAVIQQLLFALLQDDHALAVAARYFRTRYIGTPNSVDRERVPMMKSYVQKITRVCDKLDESFELGNYDIPLMTAYCYSAEDRCGYWSAPLPVFSVPVDDSED